MGKSLHEIMGWDGPMTHRQFAAWQLWLESRWDRPARSDFYLMQIAYEVRRSYVKNPNRVEMEHLRLRFEKSKTSTVSKQQAADASKSRWLRCMGKGVILRKVALDGTVLEERKLK